MTHQQRDSQAIIRLRQVKARTGRCRSSIYADIREGKFPAPIHIGARAVGWLESEINAWIESRISVRRACKKSA